MLSLHVDTSQWRCCGGGGGGGVSSSMVVIVGVSEPVVVGHWEYEDKPHLHVTVDC